MDILWIYLTYVGVRAYFRSRRNGTKFTEEAKYVMNETVRGIKNLVARVMQAFTATAPQNRETVKEAPSQENQKAKEMQEVAARLDREVNAHILRKWPRSHWKYEAINAAYQLVHGNKAVVIIDTLTHLKVRAEVIIFNGVVCDVAPIIKKADVSRSDEEAKKYDEDEDDVVAQAAPHKEPEDVKTKPVAPMQPVPEDDLDNIQDPEKAEKVASTYLEDIFLNLNNMGNEAVANGKDRFTFKPDIYGGKLVLDKLCEQISARGFKSAVITSEGIEIVVDLDKPADNGNFDFESEDTKKDEKSAEKSDSDTQGQSDTVADEEPSSPIIENVDDDIILPEEPKDIPEM